MATIPSFQSILLEVHQSLGLKLESEKDKRKLAQLEKPLAAHIEIMTELIDEIFTALGMDHPTMGDAGFNLLNIGNFNTAVEQSTWTYEADMRQIVWFLSGYSYAPGLGRLVANWNLKQPLDKGMPGGRFWYLPDIRERDGAKQLVMPVTQVVEWLRDLLNQPMDHIASELGKEGNVDADTIERTLYGWLKGDVPRVDNIERYFAEGKVLNFKGVLDFDGTSNLEQRFNAALEFVKRKGLDAEELRKQIPISEPGLLEAILDGVASDEKKWHFTELLADRYASPSLRTIRQRLLIARTTQDGYRRLVKLLLGKDFDETCVDHSMNKVLQLFEIFKFTYNLTVEAYEHCGENEFEENKYFENKITPWDKFGILLSVLPSIREIAPSALGLRFSRLFSELSPGEPLEDHVGHDEACYIPVIERNCARIELESEEQVKIQAAAKELMSKPHWSNLQGITSYWVASLLAQHPELSLKVRRQVAARMRELAQSPKEAVGAIVMELGQLHNNEDILHRPKDTKARVEVLLEEAKASPACYVWRATILYYEAKHHLAFNDFEMARRLLDEALEACLERGFGKLRGQVARDAFALVVTRPPRDFSLGNYEGYYRNMLVYGGFEGEFTGTLPLFEDTACEVAEYFWEILYRPYFGEEIEQRLVKEQWEKLSRGTIGLIHSGDWIGLKAWLKKNPALRDKRLREVRGNTALMCWLKMLYEFEKKQPSLSAMTPPNLSGALDQFSSFLQNWHEAICMMIDEWPKLVSMADFKKQTPLMLATNHGDLVVVRKLLQAGADTLQQDFKGRTALHAAVAMRSISCVEELIARTPGVTSIATLDGQTVLHTAVRAGHPAIVKSLIKHAPELKTCRNEQHQTALDLAKSLLIDPAVMELHRQYMTSEGRDTGSSIDYQEIVSALAAE